MKLPAALRGIRQLAFDTAPLIYFVERHPSYFDRMLFIANPTGNVAHTSPSVSTSMSSRVS
jgi:hypothetical protein